MAHVLNGETFGRPWITSGWVRETGAGAAIILPPLVRLASAAQLPRHANPSPDDKIDRGGTAVRHRPANTERYVDDSQRGLGPSRFVVARERLVRPGSAPAAAASVPEFPGHAGRTARVPARRDENVQGTSRAKGQHGRVALPASPQGAAERAVPRGARPLRADLTASAV